MKEGVLSQSSQWTFTGSIAVFLLALAAMQALHRGKLIYLILLFVYLFVYSNSNSTSAFIIRFWSRNSSHPQMGAYSNSHYPWYCNTTTPTIQNQFQSNPLYFLHRCYPHWYRCVGLRWKDTQETSEIESYRTTFLSNPPYQ